MGHPVYIYDALRNSGRFSIDEPTREVQFRGINVTQVNII